MLTRLKEHSDKLLTPIADSLARLGLRPNQITILGFIISILAALKIAIGELISGGILVLISGFMDALDGALARRTSMRTRFGGILDSVLDRYSDALIISSAAFYLNSFLLMFLALVGAFSVSYTRARAEAEGIGCAVGVFERGERLVILALACLTGSPTILYYSLWLIALGSHLTALQRLMHARRLLESDKK